MKTLILSLVAAVVLCGCASAPKVDANGNPPPGWRLTPKMPVAF